MDNKNFNIGQPILKSIVENSIINGTLSHAYLFEQKDNDDNDDIITFVKSILCPYRDNLTDRCKDCNICKRIEDGNYLDLKIIKPDGLWIKKEQLLELKYDFSKVAIENTKRVYIVYEAEKMNAQSANSILKFLEEPEQGIVAILVTNNINKILPTILSRCQIIKLYGTGAKVKKISNLISNIFEQKDMAIEIALKFVSYIEDEGINSIIYKNELFNQYYTKKEEFIELFKIIICFYYDVVRYKNGLFLHFFDDYINLINKVSNKNSSIVLSEKLNVFLEKESYIKYNLNLNLLISELIIEIGEKNEYSRSSI